MHIEIPSLLREGSPSLSLHTVRVPKHQESASKSQEGYWAVWQCRACFWFSFPIKPEAQIILGSRIWRGWVKAGRSPEQRHISSLLNQSHHLCDKLALCSACSKELRLQEQRAWNSPETTVVGKPGAGTGFQHREQHSTLNNSVYAVLGLQFSIF